jgi:hypothetical protein
MVTHTSDVIVRDCHCLNLIHGVDAVMSMWMIQQESVRVFVGDNLGDGDAPQFCMWALPPFENCRFRDHDFGGASIVEIYFLGIVDHCVASFNKFVGAEQ